VLQRAAKGQGVPNNMTGLVRNPVVRGFMRYSCAESSAVLTCSANLVTDDSSCAVIFAAVVV
jgi:hypothetical protein